MFSILQLITLIYSFHRKKAWINYAFNILSLFILAIFCAEIKFKTLDDPNQRFTIIWIFVFKIDAICKPKFHNYIGRWWNWAVFQLLSWQKFEAITRRQLFFAKTNYWNFGMTFVCYTNRNRGIPRARRLE